MRPVAILLLAAVAVSSCSRRDPGNASDGSPDGVASQAPDAVDRTYVDQTLRETAFDVATCRRSPAMRGLDGAASAGDVIVAVDSSGSMAARAGEGDRMDEARMAVAEFVGGLPAGTRASVVAFGNVGDNRPVSRGRSCAADPSFLFGPAPVDRLAVGNAVARLRPAGWTPLAGAIRSAASRFTVPEQQKRTLFVVSDGIESCGGDPVAAARDVHAEARVVVNVIGFGVDAPAEVAALTRVAQAGGGSYRGASAGGLLAALKAQSVAAQDANAVSVALAETGMQGCYLSGIGRARDALMARIERDRAAGRISQPTYAALVDASMKRFQTSYDDFVKTHEANMSRAAAAKAHMGDAVANETRNQFE